MSKEFRLGGFEWRDFVSFLFSVVCLNALSAHISAEFWTLTRLILFDFNRILFHTLVIWEVFKAQSWRQPRTLFHVYKQSGIVSFRLLRKHDIDGPRIITDPQNTFEEKTNNVDSKDVQKASSLCVGNTHTHTQKLWVIPGKQLPVGHKDQFRASLWKHNWNFWHITWSSLELAILLGQSASPSLCLALFYDIKANKASLSAADVVAESKFRTANK